MSFSLNKTQQTPEEMREVIANSLKENLTESYQGKVSADSILTLLKGAVSSKKGFLESEDRSINLLKLDDDEVIKYLSVTQEDLGLLRVYCLASPLFCNLVAVVVISEKKEIVNVDLREMEDVFPPDED